MKLVHLGYFVLILFIIGGFSLHIQYLNKNLKETQAQINFYIQEVSKLQKEKQELLVQQTEEVSKYQNKINNYVKQLKIKDKKIMELKNYIVKHSDNECEDLKNALFDLSNLN